MESKPGNSWIGLGTDLVEIARLRESIQRSGELFLKHVYAEEELSAVPKDGPRRLEFFAGRWAAKEALAKALGTGIGAKCHMNEICVLNDADGRPVMTLTGTTRATADALGVTQILLSLSHDGGFATATVLLA